MQDWFAPTKDSMDVMRAAEEKGKEKVGASEQSGSGGSILSYFDLPVASTQQSSFYYWKLKT